MGGRVEQPYSIENKEIAKASFLKCIAAVAEIPATEASDLLLSMECWPVCQAGANTRLK